jgi:hypothetical protein
MTMAEYVHLIGAEDVRRAGSEMSSAASDMQRAASSISHCLEMHHRSLDDWLMRLQHTFETAGRAALAERDGREG